MVNVTEMEKVVLGKIAVHEMNSLNGDTPQCAADVNTFCWPEDFTGCKMTINQVKGVLSSLVKKKFVEIDDEDFDSPAVCFTDLGFEVWKGN